MKEPTRRARTFRFVTIDVFTREPLAGNYLAVFTDARGLSNEQMQALARETRLPETTFVFPQAAAVEKQSGVKVRIFTVEEELPFAGHPTLGTAFVVRGKKAATEIVLDLKVGKIPVRFHQREGATFGEMKQRDPTFGSVHAAEDVARASGLKLDEIDTRWPIQTVSTGLPQAIVPVRSLAAIRGIQFEWPRAAEYLAKTDARFFYFVTRETEDRNCTLHARMLFYGGEDPATGSAGGNTVSWMVEHGIIAPEEHAIIEQGLEMKRPSKIFVRAAKRNQRVCDVRVGGYAVEVMRGEVKV
jgi:trans-2,3-dihydro-3-hydroxyanthranilate isomerase